MEELIEGFAPTLRPVRSTRYRHYAHRNADPRKRL